MTITSSIQQCSESVIPKCIKPKDEKPWIDEEFLQLVDSRNKFNKNVERREWNKEVRKHRNKMENAYYSRKANQMNNASEARDVEEEFRVVRNYTALNKSKRLLIDPMKLKDHFENHIAPRPTDIQNEIENPELFPHILPPYNLQTNEDIPDEEEIRDVLKKQKDNKCRGTDEIH